MAQSTRFPSDHVSPASLGEPLKFEFSGLTAKNRFMKAAMSEHLASWDTKNPEARGIPSPELINVYRQWGEGGWGIILTGNVIVDQNHLESPGNMSVPPSAPFSGERFEAFQDMATQSKKHGSLIVAQISHPGRQVSNRLIQDPISASDVKLEGEVLGMQFNKPHTASEAEIKELVGQFAHTAEYLHKAGFDGVQLHAAHGYLLVQFLSRTTNKRTDMYGGSLENRARIIVEIAQEIKTRVPNNFSLQLKLNSVEFQKDGFTVEEAAELSQILEDNGFDMLELSGGTYEALAFTHKRDSTRKREAYFLEFADQIRPLLKKTKTYVVGGLRSVGGMVKALDTVDGVSIARPAATEPSLPNDILSGKVKAAIQPLLDQDDFVPTHILASAHISQLGRGEHTLDLSQQKNYQIFGKSVQAWLADMADNADGAKFGNMTFVTA